MSSSGPLPGDPACRGFLYPDAVLWASWVYSFANLATLALGTACLLAALALVWRPALHSGAEAWFRRTARTRGGRAGLWAAGLAVPAFAALVKLAMYASFQLTRDSANVVQFAWNFAHGYGAVSTLSPPTHLAFHFSFTSLLLSPLLRLWDSTAVFALVYGAAVGAVIPGVYLLARRRTKSPLHASLAALLAACHPLYLGMVGTIIEDSSLAPAIFIWGVYFWECGQTPAALAAAALLLTTKEQAPFVLAGFGLYLAARREDRRLKTGLALAAACVLCWFGEMAFIDSMRGGDWAPGSTSPWTLFPWLDVSHGPIAGLIHGPWRAAVNLVTPPVKLLTAAKLFFFAGGLPLVSGAPLLAVLVPWLPQQLADWRLPFHQLGGSYAGFVLGPLLWAAVAGYCVALERLAPRGRTLLAAGLLLVAGLGAVQSAGYYRPRLMPSSWRKAVPDAMALIPPDAKVWCDGYLLPQLALRRYVKKLPNALPDPFFELEPFVPDRVLLSAYWLAVSDPATVRRVLATMSADGLVPVFREKDLVLYAPAPPAARAAR